MWDHFFSVAISQQPVRFVDTGQVTTFCVLSVSEGQSWNPTVEVLMTERMPVSMPRVPRNQRTRFYQNHQPKINDFRLRLRIFGAYPLVI